MSVAEDPAQVFAANRAVGRIVLTAEYGRGITRRRRLHESGGLRMHFPGQRRRELEAVLINTAGGIADSSANRSFSRELGVQLGLLIGANHGNILTGGTGQSSPFNRTPPPRATIGGGGGLPLAVDLPAAGTSGLAFLMQPGSNILLDEIITAAEAKAAKQRAKTAKP